MEVDVAPLCYVDRLDDIDGNLGELSMFHRSHGFYVHGLSIDAAVLPTYWDTRVIRVSDPIGTHGKTGLCLEVHDLAASKLAAFRDKDKDFVRVLLKEHLAKPRVLMRRLRTMAPG